MRISPGIRFPTPSWAGTGRGLVSATVGGVTGAGLLAPGVGALGRNYASSLGGDPDVWYAVAVGLIAWLGSAIGCRFALRAYGHPHAAATPLLLLLVGPLLVAPVVLFAPDGAVGVLALLVGVVAAPLISRLVTPGVRRT